MSDYSKELLILKYCALRFCMMDGKERFRFLDYFISLNEDLNNKGAKNESTRTNLRANEATSRN